MSVLFADACAREFARHETFAPRFGWLRKAYQAVVDFPEGAEVFVAADAPVQLGVGKNMVNAIRYWAQAFKLTVEAPKGGTSRAMVAVPTYRAYWLLDEEHGADPWMEDPASLWLLHWWLLEDRCLAPAWWAAFHLTPGAQLVEADLVRTLRTQIQLAGWDTVAETSLEKDADAIAKMYAPRRGNSLSPGSGEDLLDCPFRDLGLLTATDMPRVWSFTSGARPTLAPAVVLYAALDFARAEAGSEPTGDGGTIAITRLAGAPGSPGRAFRIDEVRLIDALELACAQVPGARLVEVAGQRVLAFDRDPAVLGLAALEKHYQRNRSDAMTESEWRERFPASQAARRLVAA